MLPTSPITTKRPEYYTDLHGCARCRGSHYQVAIFELTNPTDGLPRHYFMCPRTQEPVFVWVTDHE